jgi:hypothetical protein
MIQMAAQVGSFPILRVLVDDAGTKVGSLNAQGENCLHIAAREASPELIGWLLLRMSNEDIQKASAMGHRPWDLAVTRSKSSLAGSWNAMAAFVERESPGSLGVYTMYWPLSNGPYVQFRINSVLPSLHHQTVRY